jgi:type VI secretion system secreted protein VgrG
VLASPAGIHSTAGTTTHIASIEHTALSSGGHTSISAGKSLLASVKDAVRLFAYKAIRLTAATAGIDIVALQDSIKLMAKLDIKLEANRISITAKEEIVINGGSSYTRWNASGIVHGTQGVWLEHAATHSFAGPDSRTSEMMNQDVKAPFDQEVIFHHLDEKNTPAAKQGFKLTRDGEPAPPPGDRAKKGGATTSTDGTTRMQRSDGPEVYRVRWMGKTNDGSK